MSTHPAVFAFCTRLVAGYLNQFFPRVYPVAPKMGNFATPKPETACYVDNELRLNATVAVHRLRAFYKQLKFPFVQTIVFAVRYTSAMPTFMMGELVGRHVSHETRGGALTPSPFGERVYRIVATVR